MIKPLLFIVFYTIVSCDFQPDKHLQNHLKNVYSIEYKVQNLEKKILNIDKKIDIMLNEQRKIISSPQLKKLKQSIHSIYPSCTDNKKLKDHCTHSSPENSNAQKQFHIMTSNIFEKIEIKATQSHKNLMDIWNSVKKSFSTLKEYQKETNRLKFKIKLSKPFLIKSNKLHEKLILQIQETKKQIPIFELCIKHLQTIQKNTNHFLFFKNTTKTQYANYIQNLEKVVKSIQNSYIMNKN